MSGLEIAGVVLGAFPIAITLLEKYHHACRAYKSWRQIKREYANCRRDLVYYQKSFALTLKELLLPLAIDDAQVHRLIQQPGGELWKEKATEVQLRQRLSDSYDVYLDIIQSLRDTLETIQHELSLDKEKFQAQISKIEHPKLPKAPKNSYRPSPLKEFLKLPCPEYELYRLKFTLGKETRKKLFDELQTLYEKLERLLQKHEKISHMEKERNTAQRHNVMLISTKGHNFWKHADRLYRSLAQAWKCNCRSQHCAKLLLQHRWQPELDFIMVFLYKPTISHLGIPEYGWLLQETNVRGSLEDDQVKDPDRAQHQTAITTLSTPSHRTLVPARTALRMPGQKRRAQEASSIAPTTILGSSTISFAGAGRSFCRLNGDAIQSLCVSFSTQCSTACFGFLEEDDTRYYLYPVQQHAQLDGTQPITLSELLHGNIRPSLTRRQRFSLALILASSFMQLRGSIWMQSSLSKVDISFLRDSMNPNILLLDKPYITKDFARSQLYGFKNQGDKTTEDTLVPHLKILGVVLLELCFGKPIERFPERADYPEGDEKTKVVWDHLAAEELLQQLQEEAGPDYANAVKWCLSDSVQLRLNQDGWRTQFCEQVVMPLEECYKILSSGIFTLLNVEAMMYYTAILFFGLRMRP